MKVATFYNFVIFLLRNIPRLEEGEEEQMLDCRKYHSEKNDVMKHLASVSLEIINRLF